MRQSSLIGIFAPIVAASERFSRSRLRSVVTEGLLTIMPALLADGGFLSELAGLITAVAGLIAAAIAWRRFRTEQRRRTEAERREDEEHEQRIKAEKRKTELEEAVVDLETILAQIPELNAITGEPMDDKIMAVIQQLITKAVQPLITRVNDLTGAVNQLRQNVDELKGGGSPPPPLPDIERQLRRDPNVQRLLKNSNWKGAADAAIAYLIHGKECSVPSWRTSNTWKQVEAAYEQLQEG